nr:translation initiation factor IF-2-like isoform X2 [Pan paniscus]
MELARPQRGTRQGTRRSPGAASLPAHGRSEELEPPPWTRSRGRRLLPERALPLGVPGGFLPVALVRPPSPRRQQRPLCHALGPVGAGASSDGPPGVGASVATASPGGPADGGAGLRGGGGRAPRATLRGGRREARTQRFPGQPASSGAARAAPGGGRRRLAGRAARARGRRLRYLPTNLNNFERDLCSASHRISGELGVSSPTHPPRDAALLSTLLRITRMTVLWLQP